MCVYVCIYISSLAGANECVYIYLPCLAGANECVFLHFSQYIVNIVNKILERVNHKRQI